MRDTHTTPHHDPARLLVVDDEPNIRELLSASLRFSGFDVETAGTGSAALTTAQDGDFDLVVLDIMLPDVDGLTVARQLRAAGNRVPIIFLTARDTTQDKIVGLTVGGDDYVTKPFSLEEVIARIRAILRRLKDEDDQSSILRVADLELNEDNHDVHRGGVTIDLSPTEFKLLRYLMINAGRVLSKTQILEHVWDYSWHGDTAIVETYISYLRRKIDHVRSATEGEAGSEVKPLIHTKRGVGYLLRETE